MFLRCRIIGAHRESERSTTVKHGHRESDSAVVSVKSLNKAGTNAAAEKMEKRALAKGNLREQNKGRTQCREALQSALTRVRNIALRDKAIKFTSLMHHVANPMRLREAFLELKRNAAAGIDGVTWSWYQASLDANIEELTSRLLRGAYRAKPVRRVYIPKPDGRERPLGVPCLEDKIVQRATVEVLNAIYESDFAGFSYGFRPGKSAHNALDAVYTGILTRNVNWILDGDISGFFDALNHDVLMELIQKRVADPRVLRLVRKWLKAGIMENGVAHEVESGSPQGGSASPLLANIFLHYVFDLWIHSWRKSNATGNVIVVRYADDFVVGFERREDAKSCYTALEKQFMSNGLTLHPQKTRVIEFGSFAKRIAKKRKQGKVSSFDFLGFTHICDTKHGNGMFTIRRRTIRKRKIAKMKEIGRELKMRRHKPIPETGKWLASVLVGHYRYYGVPGNWAALSDLRSDIIIRWRNTLRRRSQNGEISWERMARIANQWLPAPVLYHPYPLERMGVITQGKSRMR